MAAVNESPWWLQFEGKKSDWNGNAGAHLQHSAADQEADAV